MATDVFNNPSNDYVNPALSPCANVADGNSGVFKFIDDGAGVVVGTDITQFMDLSELSINVTEWSGRKQTIQSGEVIYIPGPDRGLLYKKQVFQIPNLGVTNQEYYFTIDLSISYYNNFRHYNINVDASSNYSLNLDIDDALNIELANSGVKTEVVYDPSNFTFTGTQLGYEYDITNVVLTTIDASMDSTSPFADSSTYVLTEDTSSGLPASKYPNGAMLGYLLKANYPSDECYRNWWLYMNHVNSPFDVYVVADVSTTDTSTYYSKFSKNVEVGMSGTGDATTLSAADYLDYINTNDLWFKVGKFAARFSAPDFPENSQKNLIGGFYLFNPQTFPINIEYMILNKQES